MHAGRSISLVPTYLQDEVQTVHKRTPLAGRSQTVLVPSTMSNYNSSGKPVQNLGSAVYQTFVELPYRAVTTPRHRKPPKDNEIGKMADEGKHSLKNGGQFTGPISDHFYKLFTSPESVSSVLAENPSMSPGDAWHKLYSHHTGKPSGPHSIHQAGKHTPAGEELKKAAECGHWGPTQPSELFLKVSQAVVLGTITLARKTDEYRCTMMQSTHSRKTRRTPS